MARLLTDYDYKKVTLSDTVRSLITDNYNQWLDAEQAAQLEVLSYISQRYISNEVITNTTVWDSTRLYYAKNLVQYHESDWNDLTTYAVGDRINWKGYIYECIATVTGNAPDNTTYWVKRVQDYTFYFGTLRSEEWDKDTTYAVGDIVWYLNKTYTCVQANKNLLPTDYAGAWGSGVTYTIAANSNPDIEYNAAITYATNDYVTYQGNLYKALNTTTGNLPTDALNWNAETVDPLWTLGDNRNALLVRFLLDITAYHFMRSVPARAIPDHIKEAYNGNSPNETGGAIGWLKSVSKGLVNADLPEIYATPLYSIMHGQSRDKQDNLLW